MAHRLALFGDRRAAGRKLAEAVAHLRAEEPIVLALPRGGVPVGYEVARALGAPFDIVLVRKIGAPFQPEYGLGAIAEGGVRVIRRGDVEMTGTSEEQLEAIVARETAELDRRARLYRGERPPLPVEGRTVILVDDGIATGGTAVAAAHTLKARGADRVVLAVPVAPPGSETRLADEFDAVICLEEPHGFFAIGQFYIDFDQVSDDDVVELLTAADAEANAPVPSADDPPIVSRAVEIEADPGIELPGELRLPESASGLVIFAHGSGSSRLSPRNRQVAEALNDRGLGTLLFDLLTEDEARDRAKVFDIELLATRLAGAARWARGHEVVADLPLGLFGASTGAAAALCAATELGGDIGAVVSRGGRPDLASGLAEVGAPTLLIVGGADWQVLELNELAARQLRCEHELAVVPGATHLFEEPGALERVSELASQWFLRHLAAAERAPDPLRTSSPAR